MPKKFDFLSPGIEINEVDLSVIPPTPDEEGPIIIGRTRRGPALKPVKIRNREDFISVFGQPVPGGGTGEGDIWRAGPNVSAPTYASYAAQSWLASGNSPVTMVRLLGDQHSTAQGNGVAGWDLSGSTHGADADKTKNSTAYGLFVIDKAQCGLAGAVSFGFDKTQFMSNNIADFHQQQFTITDGAGTARIYEIVDAAVGSAAGGADVEIACNSSSTTATETLLRDVVLTALKSDAGALSGVSYQADGVKKIKIFNSNAGAGSITTVSFGAFMIPASPEAIPAPSTVGKPGALAAVFYCDSGYLTLSGTMAESSDLTSSAGHLIQSTGQNQFKLESYSTTDALLESKIFDFNRNSSQYIRRIFNTNPTLVNERVHGTLSATSTTKNYWLGESFERHLAKKVTSTATGDQYAVLLPLEHQDHSGAGKNWGDHRTGMATGSSGWVIAQDDGAAINFDALNATKLFRLHTLAEGGDTQKDIMITFEDLALSPNPITYAYGTFTMRVRDLSGNTLEKYSGLSLDRNSPDYISKRIGDMYMQWDEANKRYRAQGNYINRSDYVRVEMYSASENHAQNALPFGFFGPGRPKGFGFTSAVNDIYTLSMSPGNSKAFVKGASAVPVGKGGKFVHSGEGVLNGKFEFPSLQLRYSGSEGLASNEFKVMWGIRPKINEDSSLHDSDYCDYLRPLSTDFIGQQFNPQSADGFEHSFVFTLDDIKVDESTSEVTWVSGSRQDPTPNGSYTSGSGVTGLLKKNIKRWAMPLFGGFDGLRVKEHEPFSNTLINDTTKETKDYLKFSINKALESINDSENVPANLLLAPGLWKKSVTNKVLAICESRQDMLGVIDLQGDYVPKYERDSGTGEYESRPQVSEVVDNLKARNLNTSFGCAFYPWVQVQDRYNNDAILWIPPSIAALGAMAQSQAAADVWFAPAGFNRGGLGNLGGAAGPRVLQARARLDSSERDDLYEVNINPIATFPNEGVVVYGQKTLQQTMSALDRINVRRLMLYLKSKVTAVAKTILFDNNVQATWDRFISQTDPILADVQARYGLTEYKIVLDETTTTADLVDRNVLYAKVFLKPARAIEFIVVDFLITRSGAEFV